MNIKLSSYIDLWLPFYLLPKSSSFPKNVILYTASKVLDLSLQRKERKLYKFHKYLTDENVTVRIAEF